MKKHDLLVRVLFAVSLTAISVVIDVFFKFVLNISNFGLPFYAIPLVIGSMMLGPIFGGAMALIADGLGVLMSGYVYLPLFTIAALAWGIIPGLIIRKKYNVVKLSIAVLISYLMASLANSFALYFYYGAGTTFLTLVLRLSLLPLNSVIILMITKDLYKRLEVIVPKHLMLQLMNNTQ